VIEVALALVAGLVAGRLLLATTAEVLAQPTLQRENYRGHALPTAAGVLLVAAVLAVDGARTLLGIVGLGDPGTAGARLVILAAVVLFGFLGLADDLLGDARDRGLRGHVLAALRGRVTTGFVKLGGGAAVALVLAGAVDGDRAGRVLIDAALIALAANLGNLLDRAPGRAAKWGLVAYLPVALAAGSGAAGVALAVVAGTTVALLPGDLGERFMLGDTGANALGAALGAATVLSVSSGSRDGVAVGLLALTLVSEVVSFSRVIDRVPPLRAFDRLGRRPVGETS
jgi:UDP-N-acetylmuramyl pentapeptide phosphotransferase/UDP-N-acetylglucosamine-1-phosphate transferase